MKEKAKEERGKGKKGRRLPGVGKAKEAPLRTKGASGEMEEDIRVAAYYRWLERGGEHGGHEEDWLMAEREVRRKRPAGKR